MNHVKGVELIEMRLLGKVGYGSFGDHGSKPILLIAHLAAADLSANGQWRRLKLATEEFILRYGL